MAALLGICWFRIFSIEQIWRAWTKSEKSDQYTRQLVWMGMTLLLWNLWKEGSSRLFNQEYRDSHYVRQISIANLEESTKYMLKYT